MVYRQSENSDEHQKEQHSLRAAWHIDNNVHIMDRTWAGCLIRHGRADRRRPQTNERLEQINESITVDALRACTSPV